MRSRSCWWPTSSRPALINRCSAACMWIAASPVSRRCRPSPASAAATPAKTTTYVVDFANEPDDILAAFKAYYETAELAEATDPQLILNLKAKLDSQGHYDEFEIERVVKVLLDPNAKQSQLIGALEPIAQRLMNAYKEARQARRHAEEINDPDAAKAAKDELDALTPVQKRHRHLRALLHLPLPDLRLRQHRPGEAGDAVQGACCRCWSLSGGGTRWTSARWCSPTITCATRGRTGLDLVQGDAERLAGAQSGWRLGAGQGQSPALGDHRQAQRPVHR